MITGIYKINGPNNTIYFGSAVDIESRWRLHRHCLRKGKHHSRYMQRHYNKYGESAFTFTIVEECAKEDLLDVEQDYLDWLFRYIEADKIYNMLRVAGTSIGVKRTDTFKRKLSLAKKGNTNCLGKKLSDEHKEKLSLAHKGKKLSDEHKEKLSLVRKGKNKGKLFTDEHKSKIAASLSKSYVFISPDNVITEITNLRKFCKDNNLHNGAMGLVHAGKRSSHKKWTKYNT